MFRFRFASVLNVRKLKEETLQQIFSQSHRVWQEERKKLENLYTEWMAYLEKWRNLQNQTVQVETLNLYQQYMKTFKMRITMQTMRVNECREDMERKRQKMIEATKEKKIMDRLKENHLHRYLKEEAKKEQKFMDEAGTRSFNYRRKQ